MQDQSVEFSEKKAVKLLEPVWIEVDLGALQANLHAIRRFVGTGIRTMAVVKANAYGHGLLPVTQTLMDAGVDLLGVANVVEGVALRQQGVGLKILVLGQVLPEEAEWVVQFRLTQAVGDWPVAEALNQAARRRNQKVVVHLKVDTGMSRYGVWHTDAADLYRRLAQLPGIRLEGLFSHLAWAGQSEEATGVQMDRFSQLVAQLKAEGLPVGLRHLANSVGLIKFPACRWDLVRTGLLLYGISPLREGQIPFALQAALSLKSRVRFLKAIPAGESVSYGGTYRLSRPSKIATIPVGYAHGYLRALSDRAELLIRGARAPVVGRITMEDLMADVTDIPGVQVGDEVTLIGRQGEEEVTAGELARHARTIPYEILAGLSARIPRRYV